MIIIVLVSEALFKKNLNNVSLMGIDLKPTAHHLVLF